MLPQRVRAFACTAFALLLAAPVVHSDAQQPRASSSAPSALLIGVVKDTAGAPIGNVQVVVSGANRVALTDDRGEFVLRGLAAGTYHLDLIRIGYAGQHQVVVLPPDGQDVRVTITMRVATVRLSSVNVTASPAGTDPLNVTQASVQLSGKELQRAITSSIGGTLANEPGMSSRYSGPLANAPVIRGLTGDRVLVLQDGARAGDLSSAASDHLNAVDPSSAERIEVIRGPASLLYGNNALGGVVNVISNDIPTSIPNRLSGFLMGQGESVTPGGVASAGITVPLSSRLAVTASGSFRNFDELRVGGGGRQPDTDGQVKNGTVGTGFVGTRGSLGLVLRQMDFAYGLPHAADDEGVRLDGRRRTAALQSSLNVGWAHVTSIKFDGTAQSYRHAEIESTGDIGTRFGLETNTANLTARTSVGRVSGAVGVQGLFRQYSPSGDEAFTPGADNDNVGVFVFQEVPVGRVNQGGHGAQLQIGARLDHFRMATTPGTPDEIERFGAARTRSFDNVAASLGVSLPVREAVSLTGNVSRGFRVPTVEELFANGFHAALGTFDVGNSTLAPERSTGFEVGLRSQGTRTFAQLNAYVNRIDDYILPRADGTAQVDDQIVTRVLYGQQDATLRGVEGQVETRLVGRVVGSAMGDYTRATLRDGGNLPYIPGGRLGGSLRYDNGKASMGGTVRHVFAQENVSGDALDLTTPAYTLLDLSATYLFTAGGTTVHSLTLRADNLLDERYRDATSRIKSFALNPGRNLAVVYRLLF